MSIPFFKDVLKALGKRINYEAAVNYAGNAFAKDAGKIIEQSNPLRSEKENIAAGLLGLFNNTKVTPTELITGADWAID